MPKDNQITLQGNWSLKNGQANQVNGIKKTLEILQKTLGFEDVTD